MNSPDINLLKQLITIDRDDNMAIYKQIVKGIIQSIQRNYFPISSKLPGSRNLSEILQVHRKTVIAAYDDLHAQGWIEIIPNKGTFIIQNELKIYRRGNYENHTSVVNYPSKVGFDYEKSNILDYDQENDEDLLSFTDGEPDIRLTSIKYLSSQYNANLSKNSSLKKLASHHDYGSIFFKEQLANFLNLSRGLHINHDNILTTRSIEMSLYILAQTLLNPGDILVTGSLSDARVNMTFINAGAILKTIDIDQEGICIESLKRILSKQKIRALYITPHHHYPTTVTLSAKRRVEILNLAHQHGFIIIEDDYDYEFNFEKSAIMPLASADEHGMVIYVGTFGRSLAHPFKTGFIIGPKDIIKELHKYAYLIDRQKDIIMEETLAKLINDGEIQRELKKVNKVYKQRRNNTASLLIKFFQNSVNYEIPDGGLAYWLTFNKKLPLLKIAENCKKNNLFIPRNILFQNKNITAIRLGFGNLSENEMKHSLAILSDEIKKV